MKSEAAANADSDQAAKDKIEKINAADSMIFQTENQLKEFGDKLSDDKKAPIEEALAELKAAYETRDVATIEPALEKINEAWKVASEEMYKAQAEAQGAGQAGPTDAGAGAKGQAAGESDVEDVDFEEVK